MCGVVWENFGGWRIVLIIVCCGIIMKMVYSVGVMIEDMSLLVLF